MTKALVSESHTKQEAHTRVASDVELKNVSVRFGDALVVNNVSFSVGRGEFFSLLGPSGCGKTTTLRVVAGFQKPTEGEVYIEGRSMTDVPAFKRPVNLVFQNLALFPHLNVYENIAFGLKIIKQPKGEIERRVKEMLRLVRLPGYEKRKIRELSGGEKQRVAIVRALVTQPTVLLLDEPLGPLDLKLREEMVVELKRIKREVGTTFIYVTHDQGEALAMSDRIAVMRNGIVLQLGTPLEVYEKPQSDFVAEFIGRGNLFKGSYEHGTVEVDGLGSILVKTDSQICDGSKVLVCVKPEGTSIGKRLEGLDNIFDGRIKENYYEGRVTTYKVSMGDNYLLTVLTLGTIVKDVFGVTEPVQVGWNREDATVLPM